MSAMVCQPSTGIVRCARRMVRRSPSAIARTRSRPRPATPARAPARAPGWAAAGTARCTGDAAAGAFPAAAGAVAVDGAATEDREPLSIGEAGDATELRAPPEPAEVADEPANERLALALASVAESAKPPSWKKLVRF